MAEAKADGPKRACGCALTWQLAEGHERGMAGKRKGSLRGWASRCSVCLAWTALRPAHTVGWPASRPRLMAAPTAQPEPVSAPDPLRVVFDPPLYLQRQGAIHTLVTRAANTPRFANSIHSLLDAGCGEAQLLRRLTPCDDYLPLTQLTGIDLSNDIWDPSLSETLAPGGYFGTGRPDERWRPVNVSLLHGSFEALSMDRVGRHDVIVSTEGET